MCANFGYFTLFLKQIFLEMSTSSGRNSSAKKWLQMLQSTPDARSIVTAARGNCNILKNNVMVSTVIKKNVNWRHGQFACSLTDSCDLKKCSSTLFRAPEHVNSPYHKTKLVSPIFILLGCWNDWSWIGNTNLSPIFCLGHYVAAYSKPLTLLTWRRKNRIIITIENCLLQLTPFRRATFKVKLRKVELPSTAARALNL